MFYTKAHQPPSAAPLPAAVTSRPVNKAEASLLELYLATDVARLLLNQLVECVKRICSLEEKKFGFQCRKLFADIVLYIIETVKRKMEHNGNTCAVLLDHLKIFTSSLHERYLKKAQKFQPLNPKFYI